MKDIKDFRQFANEADTNPLSVMTSERKMTAEELIRAVRFAIASEYDAIKQYMQIAEASDNEDAIKLMKDIADEEKVHAGEFLELLYKLDPREKEHYEKGRQEAEEIL
jgi:rubrerythrin